MLSKEQIQHIAKLARIYLPPRELEGYRKDLSRILDFIEKLKEVKIEKAEPVHHALNISNVVREDSPEIFSDEESGQKLINMAPEKEGGYIKVKAVLSRA